MSEQRHTIVIRDIDIPFWRIVSIMIKWAIAALPAAIIVTILYFVIITFITALLVGINGGNP